MNYRGITIDGHLAGQVIECSDPVYCSLQRRTGRLEKVIYRVAKLYYDWLWVIVWTVSESANEINIPEWFEPWALSALASAKRASNPKETLHGTEAAAEEGGRKSDGGDGHDRPAEG